MKPILVPRSSACNVAVPFILAQDAYHLYRVVYDCSSSAFSMMLAGFIIALVPRCLGESSGKLQPKLCQQEANK